MNVFNNLNVVTVSSHFYLSKDFELLKVDLLRQSTCMDQLVASESAACLVVLVQPVAATVKRETMPPSLSMWWQLTVTKPGDEWGVGLVVMGKNNKNNILQRVWFSCPGGTVSAEHLYLTSIHTWSPCPNLSDLKVPLLFVLFCFGHL